MPKSAMLILAISLFFTGFVHAGAFVDGYDDEPTGSRVTPEIYLSQRLFASPERLKELDALAKIAVRTQMRVDPMSECAKLLVQSEERLKRELTDEELERSLIKIIAITGEKLFERKPPQPEPAPIPAPAPKPRPRDDFSSTNCFTAGMMVMTPSGERPIGDLKVGDEVISLDMETRTWIKHRIHKVHVTPGQKFGTLTELSVPLEVTDSERFFTAGGLYLPLLDLTPDTTIFAPKLQPNGRYELEPVSRGAYVKNPVCATVFNLELVSEPRNFLINGILVHNGIEKGI